MKDVGNSLTCSFCHKPQEKVGKLISSPSDYPRAYICDKCIEICVAILEDDKAAVEPKAEPAEPRELHPLLSHTDASQLLGAVEDWLHAESVGRDGGEEIARLREIASKMMTSAKV